MSPELLTKILGNDNIYSATYKQADLLSDLSKLSDIKGFDLLVDTLATGNKSGVLKDFPQGLGFRYEVETAVFLQKAGYEVTEVTRKIAVKELDEFGKEITKRTDIDIVVKAFSGGPDVLVQVMRSEVALRSLPKVEEWVAKSLKHLGTTDKSRLKYVLPDGTVIPKKILAYFEKYDIEVINIPHL